MEKITVENIKIERLNEKHKIDNFHSYEQELVNFLVEDALDNQQRKISVTYLLYLLAGYISLMNDRINLEGDLKEIFHLKGIDYNSLPALKVGRLCVDDRFLRRGLGTFMLAFAVKIANYIFNNYSGCRFIVLDAKRNNQKDSIHFYKKVGFRTLKERKKGTTPMYLDLINDFKFHL